MQKASKMRALQGLPNLVLMYSSDAPPPLAFASRSREPVQREQMHRRNEPDVETTRRGNVSTSDVLAQDEDTRTEMKNQTVTRGKTRSSVAAPPASVGTAL